MRERNLTLIERSFWIILISIFAALVSIGQTLTLDKQDYEPGSTAYINGSGFQPGDSIKLQVLHDDGLLNDGENHGLWYAVADETGNFSSTWTVCNDDCLGSVLKLTADGIPSGLHAEITFSDAGIGQINLAAQTGTLIYGTAGTVTYGISVTGSGSNTTPFTTTLGVTGLPAGASSFFSTSPATLTFTGNAVTTQNLTLTVNTSSTTPANVTGYSFTITATNSSKTGSGTLKVDKKALIGTITVSNKNYDGSTTATIATRSLSGIILGDVVSYSGGTATFVSKNAGSGITVNANGLGLTGTSAANYLVNTTAVCTADILPKVIVGTITAADKVYDGNTNAVISNRSLSGVLNGDKVDFSGGAADFDNKNAGSGKLVTAAGLSLSGNDAANYSVNSTASAIAAITPLSAQATVTIANKVYDGNTSATITGRTLTGLLGNDNATLTGGTATFANPNVGTNKKVTVTGLVLEGTDAGNYSVGTSVLSSADITAKPITVTANLNQSKIYGEADPSAFTYAFDPALIGNDVFTGLLSRIAGENVGNYAITQGTLVTSANYAITFVSNDFTINPKPITITATAGQSKVYGDADPSPLTFAVVPVLLGTDTFTGALSRLIGENVGSYAINQNTLSAGANYAITFISNNFTITAKPITVTANTAQTKVYGEADPSFTYTVDPALIGTDVFTGVLNRISGENAGSYAISQNTLSAGTNYSISFVSNNFTITAKPITVTANTGQTKVYGNPDPAFTYTVIPALLGTDAFTGLPGRLTGENVGSYAINQNTLSAGTNYSISFVSSDFTITQRPVTVSANANQNKQYGSIDPVLTYQVTSGSIVSPDVFSGALSRAAGENVGTYAINVGTLALSSNYSISFVGSTFTILPASVTAAVTLSNNPQQYSDLETFTATITGGAAKFIGESGAAQSATFKVGTQVMGTANFSASGADLVAVLSNIQLLEPLPFGSATPTGQMAPGNHTVTATINDLNSNFSFNTVQPATTLTILQEDDPVYFTGAVFASTSGATSSKATVTLSATLKDITAEPGNPSYDSYAGDIRNAKVTFINRDNGSIIMADLPVGLVNSADSKVGTATYNWNVDIGSADAKQFTVGIIVKNYYVRNANSDNQVITVAKPLNNFITGGGFLNLSNSSGLKAGDVNSRNNFGFNVKFNSSGTNLQGNMNIITRRTENGVLHTYQIKGNVMSSLSVNVTSMPYKATFNGKASIKDITDPLNTFDVDGNATLQVTMTDNGEPGSSDQIGITVWSKNGGLWFASNWDGTRTTEKLLAGNSNLKVKGANSGRMAGPDSATTLAEEVLTKDEPLKIYPNPNTGMFTVEVCKNNITDETNIEVRNELGQVIYQHVPQITNGCVKENIQLDSQLPSGIYFIQVRIGKKTETTRIILAR